MKKTYCVVIVIMAGLLVFCASCAEPLEAQTETNIQSSILEEETVFSTAEVLMPSSEVRETEREFPMIHSTTALSEKNRKATEWTKNYLKTNKDTFDLVATEFLNSATMGQIFR